MNSSSDYLEKFESRWLDTWRELAGRLEASHGVEWDVWSHPFGPGGHTAGIELRSKEPCCAERVACLVDIGGCDSEPSIELAELQWEWARGDFEVGMSNQGRKTVFRESVGVDPKNWSLLEESLEEWTDLLEAVLTTRIPDYDYPFAGCVATSFPDPGFQPPVTSGQEPDFAVWSAYLDTLPETLLVAPEASGTYGEVPAEELDPIKQALREMEPSLSEEILNRFMTHHPLDLPGHLKASRPLHFAETPSGTWGYHGTTRKILGQYPGTTGILELSRVAFDGGQALFLAWVRPILGEPPGWTFALGTETGTGWSFQNLLLEPEAMEEELYEEKVPSPSLPSLEVRVPGVQGARFLDPPTGESNRLEVEFDGGRRTVFLILNRSYADGDILPNPPYLNLQNYSTPEALLEACVRWASSQSD